jgi:hypothetical protein
MRRLLVVVALFGLSVTLPSGRVSSQSPSPVDCVATTEAENLAMARKWHEDVINRRNPAVLRDILAPRLCTTRRGAIQRL